jgi:hypothetical protein
VKDATRKAPAVAGELLPTGRQRGPGRAATGRPIAVLVPLADKMGLSVSAAGHYRGTPGQAMARQLVYVVDTGHGLETLSPAEFEKKYGWKNDPEQVRLAP